MANTRTTLFMTAGATGLLLTACQSQDLSDHDVRAMELASLSAGTDSKAGDRSYAVGWGGDGQWMADVNGDGRADYVYNRDGTREYRVMLANDNMPYGNGEFSSDTSAGSRNSNNNVGYGGRSQWMADVNGDGRADYVYNRDNTHEYWVMLANDDGTFETDKLAGSRNSNNNVGWGGKGAWMADVNGDGRADHVYNRDKRHEYWVMLAKDDGTFETDRLAGSRNDNNNVGYSGDAQWMADVNGDGCADYVYNRDKRHEYWVMLSRGDGTFHSDKNAGSRDSNNNVGYSGDAQWMVDVSGDGRADYVYNRDKTHEYWVMTAKPDGSFSTDTNWGTRNERNNVGYGVKGQGFADLNADGCADFIYNRDNTHEYWVMLSTGDLFATDTLWGTRNSNNNVGWSGRGAWMADVTGDGLDDFVYNRDNTRENWVMPSKLPSTGSGQWAHVFHLDVWGEGYIHESGITTGFQDAYNLQYYEKTVSNGPNKDKSVPKLIAVDTYNNPAFPIATGAVEVMTSMGSPLDNVANEMYRTINANSGAVILYAPTIKEKDAFDAVFITKHGWYDVTATTTLLYPYLVPTERPYFVYYPYNKTDLVLGYGIGGRVGGAGRSRSTSNAASGGAKDKDEL